MRLLAVSLLVFSSVVSAGSDYHSITVDTYDPVTGLYYNTVLNRQDRGFMSKDGSGVVNIAIFNPSTGSIGLLFKEPLQGTLSSVLFEIGHKDGTMQFYGAGRSDVKNNVGIPNRAPKNRLLVAVRDGKKKETALFGSEKDGSKLKKLIVVPDGDDWHIDVRNSKLRVVHQLGSAIKIESIEW